MARAALSNCLQVPHELAMTVYASVVDVTSRVMFIRNCARGAADTRLHAVGWQILGAVFVARPVVGTHPMN